MFSFRHLAILSVFAAIGCSSNEKKLQQLEVGGTPTAPVAAVGGPCNDGATQACHVTLGVHEGVLSCYSGVQHCAQGSWGACGDGAEYQLETQLFSVSASTGKRLTALSTASACVNNPCDPSCQQFDERPPAPVIPDKAMTTPPWVTGTPAGLPAGLFKKGLVEPCQSGADCQFNYQCLDVKTDVSCEHSKCTTGAALTQACDPCVSAICTTNPECCTAVTACAHDPCTAGAKLSSKCDTNVGTVCAASSGCCKTKWDAACVASYNTLIGGKCGAVTSWSAACVDKVKTICGATCGADAGTCSPRAPDTTEATCAGYDLAAGIPCEGKIPVCNHGTKTAPAGIEIVHFPANSQQYPKCDPDLTHPQMMTCTTKASIAPGKCITVDDCPGLSGNREIMINPAGAKHVAECVCLDNWTLYSNGVTCVAPNCSSAVSEAAITPVNMLFVVDRSGSMAGAKWDGATGAMSDFFSATSSAGIKAALEFFPLSSGATTGDGCAPNKSSCSSTPCSNPMVPSGTLTAATGASDPQETALLKGITDVGAPSGGTPTSAALSGALSWAKTSHTAKPSELYVVILITDGEPTWCDTDNDAIAALAGTAYTDDDTLTFTISLDGSDTAALDKIALAGGTQEALVVTGGDTAAVSASLTAALQKIANSTVSCTIKLPNQGAFDPTGATVTFTPSSGSPSALTQAANAAACGAGWYYDDPANPASMTLCPSTCATVQADTGGKLGIEIACPSPWATTVKTEIYQATCPTGAIPQWRYLAYNTTTPSDSSVQFRVRTAGAQVDLAAQTWIDIVKAQASPNTQVCKLSGPSPCPTDLFTPLGVPLANQAFLELQMTLNPSTDTLTGPRLNDWQVLYSCPAGQ